MSNITLLEKHLNLFNALNPEQTKNLILNILGNNEIELDSVTSLVRTTILSDNNELDISLQQLKKKKLEISEKRRIAGSLGGKKTQAQKKENQKEEQKTSELSTILKQNQANSSKTKQIQAKPSICFPPTPPFISSQSINKYNNIFSAHLDTCQRASEKTEKERKFLISIFGDLYANIPNPIFRNAYYEVLDTLIEAIYQANTENGLLFKHKRYKLNDMLEMIKFIDFEDNRIERLMFILRNKKNYGIKNYPFYIFGALVNASDELKSQISNFMEEK